MKSARRFALIPEDHLLRLERLQKHGTTPIVRNLMQTEVDMDKTLARTDISDNDK